MSQYQLNPAQQAQQALNIKYAQSLNPYPPAPVQFDGTPFPPVQPADAAPVDAANPFSACDPLGQLANAISNLTNYYADNVSSPMATVSAAFDAQTAAVNQLVNQPMIKASNSLLGLSGANVKISVLQKPVQQNGQQVLQPKNITNSSAYANQVLAQLSSSSQNVPVSSVGTEQLFASMGVPFATSKESTEDALINKGIYVVNGLWIPQGYLDMSCAKKLGALLGGTDICAKLTPYLSKPAGSLTTCIVHAYQASSLPLSVLNCEVPVPVLPTGSCAPQEVIQDVEDVLAFDASIYAVLASFPELKRSDLKVYAFWNQIPNASQANTLLLQSQGYTNAEITLILSAGTSGNVASCVIAQPADILAYVCGVDDQQILKGPDAVDPSPSTNSLVDEILAKALTPRPPTAAGVDDRDNVPAMVLGLIDLKQTFKCPASGPTAGLEDGLAQATAAIDVGFDAANSVLAGAQGLILTAGNTLSNILTMVQQYLGDAPGNFLSCMFPGQGLELSLPLPRAVLNGMQFILNTQIGTIEQSLGLFDNLMSGVLAGFCISTSLVSGLIGPTGASVLGAAASLVSASTDSPISCASFEIPWPNIIMDYLQCLLKIMQLVQRLIRGAISSIRNLFSALQSLSTQFGFHISHGMDTCNPAQVINAVAAIQAQMATLT